MRGAREHNLKDVDVDIPRGLLVVFTGVSGSGKSSLAFGTLYAEAQRRFFDSVSPYARRFIDQVGTPDVDSIEGMPPAIALQQQRGASNIRSSIGSMTTVSNLLRMLFSRAGTYPARQAMLYAEDFSPNTPQGACPRCHGLGQIHDVSEASMVPDPDLTIRERAIAAWPPAWHGQNLRDILVTRGVDVDLPWRRLPKKLRDWILYTEEQPRVPVYAGFTPAETRAALRRGAEPSYHGTFIGARKYILQTYATTQSALMKKRVARFLSGSVCPACGGKRLKPASLSVRVAGHDIGALEAMGLAELMAALGPIAEGRIEGDTATAWKRRQTAAVTRRRAAEGVSTHAAAADVRLTRSDSEEKRLVGRRLAGEILARLQTLRDLGLDYLALERSAPTLSPGELQRIRLATQIQSPLFGVVYVLDEPTAGLHPVDGDALMAALDRLKAGGNSLFVVEHDPSLIRRADWVVDVGPLAGTRGGEVLYSGPVSGLQDVADSQTGRYLFRPREQPGPPAGRSPTGSLELDGVHVNNLHGLRVSIPLGVMTAVTGVSGSGKSSLISRALIELVGAQLRPGAPLDPAQADDDEPRPVQAVRGSVRWQGADLRRLVQVDQKPIGRTPRSTLATYTGLFDDIRDLFAALPAARKKHYRPGRFSFNVAGGRCETCEGEGYVSVELLFMPSVYAPCSTCHGQRYNPATLDIRCRGKNIAEVLDMTVDEALDFFAPEPGIARGLKMLSDIGTGYLRLGQPATELSGGEAQRIKLATELQRPQRGLTLYVLDEPTTGLHPADVARLLTQLERLVEAGNTVVVVEHDLDLIAASDWVIDIGPGAGNRGGEIVACGAPEAIARDPTSRIAPYLSAHLSGADITRR